LDSVDPIKTDRQKGKYYWRVVAIGYNINKPKKHENDCFAMQDTLGVVLRADIAKFCGAYSKVRSTYCSGHSDDIVMEKARKWYKGKNQNKSFTLEYLCRDLKDLPKWHILPEEDESKNKGTKISEPEAYTSSSNQDTKDETMTKRKSTEEQKKAKAKLKGKTATLSPLGDLC
jgi:hypothetical protein